MNLDAEPRVETGVKDVREQESSSYRATSAHVNNPRFLVPKAFLSSSCTDLSWLRAVQGCGSEWQAWMLVCQRVLHCIKKAIRFSVTPLPMRYLTSLPFFSFPFALTASTDSCDDGVGRGHRDRDRGILRPRVP